ncbi:MAG: flagellar basal body P-ring formation chaperone FlgA [Succinivibrionaceae bacterium]
MFRVFYLQNFIFVKRIFTTIISLFFAYSLAIPASAFDENDEYKNQILEEISDFINRQLVLEDDEKAEIIVNPYSRNYPICEGELKYAVASGKIRKNNSIKVECLSETTPYSFYVTSRVTIQTPFVTVINPVSKKDTLSSSNLTIAYQDKTLDKGTTFKDIEKLDGIKVKRDLKPGQPIHKNQICVVCKGDEVIIEATNGNFSIKTTGESLEDGSYNEKIKVKNLKSGKIVKAVVADVNLVRILLK